ncbi:hypothetical protein ACLB2K_058455 [Fragaria x ananassa]
MANSHSLPFYERVEHRNTLHKVMEFIMLFLLLSLLVYRLLSFNKHGLSWFIALLCELWFTFSWVITMNNKWNIVDHKPYPDRLLQRVPKDELPAVDLFVTTADSELEPPIITINTVLSLLAVDYPTNKLACYVSDDGCSPITFYSLMEASKFAKIWVPFCKKYNVQVRAPFRYFTNNSTLSGNNNSSMEFKQEWKRLKDEYEKLSRKIEDAVLKSINPSDMIECDFSVFSNIQRNDHPTIIKYVGQGISGIQGPFYSGTGCVHRRKVIYGLFPNFMKVGETNAKTMMKGKSADEELFHMFGKEFAKSAANALNGKAECPDMLTTTIEAAYQVAGVDYEYGTHWGSKV